MDPTNKEVDESDTNDFYEDLSSDTSETPMDRVLENLRKAGGIPVNSGEDFLFQLVEEVPTPIQWESDGLSKRDDVINRYFDFDEAGMSLIRGRVDFLNPPDYDRLRSMLGDLAVEVYLRAVGSLRTEFSGEMDVKLPNVDHRVDFIKRDSEGRIISAVEFKTYLRAPADHKLLEDVVELKKKYKSSSPDKPLPIQFYLIVIDQKFIGSLSSSRTNRVPKWISKLLSTMRAKTIEALSQMTERIGTEEDSWKDNLPTFDELVNMMPWKAAAEERFNTLLPGTDLHKIVREKDSEGKVHQKRVPYTLEDLTIRTLKFMPAFEEFANNNYISIPDMGNYIPTYIGESSTIKGNFWSRDQNQVKTALGYKGVRASYLMHIAVHRGNVEKLDDQDWVRTMQSSEPESAEYSVARRMAETLLMDPVALADIKRGRDLKAYLRDTGVTPDLQKRVEEHTGRYCRNIFEMKESLQNHFEKTKKAMAKTLTPGVSVTRRGSFSVQLSRQEKQHMGIGTTKWTKKESKIEERAGLSKVDGLEASNFDWTQIYEHMPIGEEYEMDFAGAYPDGDIGRESDKLAKMVSAFGARMCKSRQMGGLMSLLKSYQAIVMGMPRSETKKARMNEFFICSHPESEIRMIASAPPNDQMSGCIICVAVLTEKLPPWYIDGEYVKLENGRWLYISRCFRLNRKIMEGFDRNVTSYLGTEAFANQTGTSIMSDGLMYSLQLSYTRQLALTFDLVYLMYKNGIGEGNFGKYKIEDKFKPLYQSDVRVAAIFNRLKRNWGRVGEAREHLEKKGKPFKDFIFDHTHTGLQSFLGICYLKQQLLADDGIDKSKQLFGYFTAEMEHETDWRASPFHETRYKPETMNSETDMDYFFENLLVSNKKWQPVTYCRTAIGVMITELVSKAAEEDDKILNGVFEDTMAMDAIRKSKVMVSELVLSRGEMALDPKYAPRSRNPLMESTDELKRSEHSYPGLRSSDLGDAVAEGIRMMRTEVINSPRLKNNPFYDPRRKYKISEADVPSSLLALYSSMMTRKSVLKLEHKIQIGYAGRGFLVQTVDVRNILSYADSLVRKILRAVPGDFILIPGNKKYIKVEDALKRLKIVDMIISQDETRFGDTFVIQALEWLIMFLFSTSYFTKEKALFMLNSLSLLKGRFVLFPSLSMKFWKKHQELGEKFKSTFGEGGAKFEETVTQYTQLLHETFDNSDPNRPDLYSEAYRNPGFYKSIGFTLGVLNMIGSIMTAAHCQLAISLMSKFGLSGFSEYKSHSDDSIQMTTLPCPKEENFKVGEKGVVYFSEKVIDFILSPFVVMTGTVHGGMKFTRTDKKGEIRLPRVALAKLFVDLTMLVTRMMGEQASLLKWMISRMGEVLQSVVFEGRAIAPLVRYMIALGSKTDGVSPGQDLMSSVGRIFDIGNNGGGTEMCSLALWILNHHVYRIKYSYPAKMLGVNKMLNFGGLMWGVPSELITSGFGGNLARLLSWTEQDERIKRMMEVCVFDRAVWAQKSVQRTGKIKGTANDEEADDIEARLNGNDMGNYIISELEAGNFVPISDYTGAVLVFKDLMLGYAITAKTRGSFMDNFAKWEPDIMRKVKSSTVISEQDKSIILNPLNRPGIRVKLAADTLALETMAGVRDLRVKIVTRLSQSISSSSARAAFKVPISWSIITQKGYLRRQIRNPFSVTISDILGLNKESLISIQQVIECLDKLSLKKEIDPVIKVGASAINQMVRLHASEVNNIHNTTIEVIREYDQILEERGNYMEIPDARGFSGFEIADIKPVLSAIIEMGMNGGRMLVNDTVAYRTNPIKVLGHSRSNHIKLVREFILGMGVPDTSAGWKTVLQQRELFMRVLSYNSVKLVHKVVETTTPRLVMTGPAYSLRVGRVVVMKDAINKAVAITPFEVQNDSKYRMWAIYALHVLMSPLRIIRLQVGRDASTTFVLNSKELWDKIVNSKFTKGRASLWMLICCFEMSMNEEKTLKIWAEERNRTLVVRIDYNEQFLAIVKDLDSGKFINCITTWKTWQEVEIVIQILRYFVFSEPVKSQTQFLFDLTAKDGDFSTFGDGKVGQRKRTGNIPVYVVDKILESAIQSYNTTYGGCIEIRDTRTHEIVHTIVPWEMPEVFTGLNLHFTAQHRGFGVILGVYQSILCNHQGQPVLPNDPEATINWSLIDRDEVLKKEVDVWTIENVVYRVDDTDNRQMSGNFRMVCMDEGMASLMPQIEEFVVDLSDLGIEGLGSGLSDRFMSLTRIANSRIISLITGKPGNFSTISTLDEAIATFLVEFLICCPITLFYNYVLEKIAQREYAASEEDVGDEELIPLCVLEELAPLFSTMAVAKKEETKRRLLYKACMGLRERLIETLGDEFSVAIDQFHVSFLDHSEKTHVYNMQRVSGKFSMSLSSSLFQTLGYDGEVCTWITSEIRRNSFSKHQTPSMVGYTTLADNLALFMAVNNTSRMMTLYQKMRLFSVEPDRGNDEDE